MRTIQLLLTVCLASGWTAATAAERTITWSDAACRYRLFFDPAKADEKRLRNTVRLLLDPTDFAVPMTPFVATPQDISKLDLDRTTQQCGQWLDAVDRLALVPLKGIEDYRRARIADGRDFCEFQITKIRGFKDPAALRDYKPGLACSAFIDALEGKTDLMTVFRQTLDQTCKNNAAPKQCVERELANLRKPDGPDWARLFVMDFGWSNCAVKHTLTQTEDRKREQLRLGLEKQLRQAFRVRKDQCETP